MDVLAATDFFTVEVLTPGGLITYYVLFFIHVGSRRIHIAGATPNPDERWVKQLARNVTMADVGFLEGCRYLIHDRDTKFSLRFRIVLEAAGIELIRTPFQAPNANAYAERFVRSIKEECLNRMILFGEGHLRRAISEYLAHYHGERNHQGLENELIDGCDQAAVGEVATRERLGGLLRYYHRAA